MAHERLPVDRQSLMNQISLHKNTKESESW